MRLILLLVLNSVLLMGCSLAEKDPTEGWSAKRLYDAAKSALDDNQVDQSIKYFETLEARYPFGRFALQAQLDIAYAYYQQDEVDNAIAAADRFIKLHPRNPHIDYALYLKGLANYKRGASFLDRFFPRDLSRVDQAALRSAFNDFSTLLSRFPNSKYSEDAQKRMLFLRNEMAHHELNTAKFYYKRGALLATVGRVRYMLENYDGSAHQYDALALMAQAYEKMGEEKLASDTRRVLALNAPDHPYLQPKKEGFFEKLGISRH